MDKEKIVCEFLRYVGAGAWSEVVEMIESHTWLPSYTFPENGMRGILNDVVCFGGAVDVVQMLLSLGANPNSTASDGATPLGNAIRCQNRIGLDTFDVIKALVEGGASLSAVDDTGNPPMHSALYHGRIDIMNYFLDKGADPYQKNTYGDSLYEWASYLGRKLD